MKLLGLILVLGICLGLNHVEGAESNNDNNKKELNKIFDGIKLSGPNHVQIWGQTVEFSCVKVLYLRKFYRLQECLRQIACLAWANYALVNTSKEVKHLEYIIKLIRILVQEELGEKSFTRVESYFSQNCNGYLSYQGDQFSSQIIGMLEIIVKELSAKDRMKVAGLVQVEVLGYQLGEECLDKSVEHLFSQLDIEQYYSKAPVYEGEDYEMPTLEALSEQPKERNIPSEKRKRNENNLESSQPNKRRDIITNTDDDKGKEEKDEVINDGDENSNLVIQQPLLIPEMNDEILLDVLLERIATSWNNIAKGHLQSLIDYLLDKHKNEMYDAIRVVLLNESIPSTANVSMLLKFLRKVFREVGHMTSRTEELERAYNRLTSLL